MIGLSSGFEPISDRSYYPFLIPVPSLVKTVEKEDKTFQHLQAAISSEPPRKLTACLLAAPALSCLSNDAMGNAHPEAQHSQRVYTRGVWAAFFRRQPLSSDGTNTSLYLNDGTGLKVCV